MRGPFDQTLSVNAFLDTYTEEQPALQEAFRDRVPDIELDLVCTDDGVDAHDVPYVSVTVPGITDETVIITRGEVTGPDGASKLGWQMHQGDDGPLYVFASEREVAEFLGSGMSRL